MWHSYDQWGPSGNETIPSLSRNSGGEVLSEQSRVIARVWEGSSNFSLLHKSQGQSLKNVRGGGGLFTNFLLLYTWSTLRCIVTNDKPHKGVVIVF